MDDTRHAVAASRALVRHLGPAGEITSLEGLEAAVRAGRAVRGTGGFLAKPRPAAFVMAQQGTTLLRVFRAGLYLYEKKSTQKIHLQCASGAAEPVCQSRRKGGAPPRLTTDARDVTCFRCLRRILDDVARASGVV